MACTAIINDNDRARDLLQRYDRYSRPDDLKMAEIYSRLAMARAIGDAAETKVITSTIRAAIDDDSPAHW